MTVTDMTRSTLAKELSWSGKNIYCYTLLDIRKKLHVLSEFTLQTVYVIKQKHEKKRKKKKISIKHRK